MKQPYGARPARSCLLSKDWTVANHKREGAVSVSVVGNTCWPTGATRAAGPPFQAIDAELDRGRGDYGTISSQMLEQVTMACSLMVNRGKHK